MKVHVKWGKEVFKDVEVDMEQPPLVFKSQLFALSGVSPDRQKVMVKSKLLDDASWDSISKLKDGQTILMMGSAEIVSIDPPSKPIVFVEDLPEEEQDLYDFSKYGAGLENLGNTCYMNATLQLLYAIPELKEQISNFAPSSQDTNRLSSFLISEAGNLFKEMQRKAEPVEPFRFLNALRSQYSQFAQRGREGWAQQDAEECFSQILQSLTHTLRSTNGSQRSLIEDLLGIDFVTHLKCEETQEAITLNATETKLKCNIPVNPPVDHVHQGVREGLKADRTQRSEQVQRDVLFEGKSEIERLPPYLVLHMVRFLFRTDTNRKAKILKKVVFPAIMDLYEFCSESYKKELDIARSKFEELRNKEVANQTTGTNVDPSPSGPPASAETSQDQEMPDISRSVQKAFTGRFHVMGLLTHKGRNADSGHYVAWIKQEDGQWIEFDDDSMIPVKEEEILQLSGGGDWHMAYLILFKAETVDLSVENQEPLEST